MAKLKRQSELARLVQKRLDVLALDFPPPWRDVLHAEAKAMAAVVEEFQSKKNRPAQEPPTDEGAPRHTLD